MECLFPCFWHYLGHYWQYFAIPKQFEGRPLFVWKRFSLLFVFDCVVYGINGVSFRTKSQVKKEAAYLGPYQYLLSDCRYLYTCLSYGSAALKGLVAVIFGLGNRPVWNYPKTIFYREI